MNPYPDIKEKEFITSLSVGDGRYLVDLGRYADVITNNIEHPGGLGIRF